MSKTLISLLHGCAFRLPSRPIAAIPVLMQAAPGHTAKACASAVAPTESMDHRTQQLHASMMSKLATVGMPLASIAQLRSALIRPQAAQRNNSNTDGHSTEQATLDEPAQAQVEAQPAAPAAAPSPESNNTAQASVADSVAAFLQQPEIQTFIAQQVQREQAAHSLGLQRADREAKRQAAEDIVEQAKPKRAKAAAASGAAAKRAGLIANTAAAAAPQALQAKSTQAKSKGAAATASKATATIPNKPKAAYTKQALAKSTAAAAAAAAPAAQAQPQSSDAVVSADAAHDAAANCIPSSTKQPTEAVALGKSACMSEGHPKAEALKSRGPGLVECERFTLAKKTKK